MSRSHILQCVSIVVSTIAITVKARYSQQPLTYSSTYFNSSIYTTDHGHVRRCTKCKVTIFPLARTATCSYPDRTHSVQWTLSRLTLQHSHWCTYLKICNYWSFNSAGSSLDLHDMTWSAGIEERIYRGLIWANILEFELRCWRKPHINFISLPSLWAGIWSRCFPATNQSH